ncbi:MAG: hypothetical protein E4H01_08360, partial [Lysobacterales bacterium]
FKRIVDILASLLGLIFLSPVFNVIGAAIKRYSKGPVFYHGERIGREGKPFKILKFRTMQETLEAHNGARITAQDDPRVTRLGRFLREAKLNELPQLFNVLKGEMSLVGPRPEDPSFVEHYTDEQREVLSVRPGITSLASVIYSNEEKQLVSDNLAEKYLSDILPNKLRLDLIYVRNVSLLLDLDILFRTFTVLVPRLQKANLHAEDIFLGPFRSLQGLASWFSIDVAVALVAVVITGFVWSLTTSVNLSANEAALVALCMTAVFTLMNMLTGVQKVQWRYASIQEAASVMLSVGLATLLLVLLNQIDTLLVFPDRMLIVTGTFALAGFLGVRYRRQLFAGLLSALKRLGPSVNLVSERVLVVGSGEAGQLAIWLLQNSSGAEVFHIVGIVDDDLTKIGKSIHRIPVLGRTIRIADLVARHDIGLILFAIHTIDARRRYEILQKCWRSGARTIVMPYLLSLLRNGHETQAGGAAGVSKGAYGGQGEAPLVDRELYQSIVLLAEMARLGEYALVSEKLFELERLIVTRQPNGNEPEFPETLAGDSEQLKS